MRIKEKTRLREIIHEAFYGGEPNVLTLKKVMIFKDGNWKLHDQNTSISNVYTISIASLGKRRYNETFDETITRNFREIETYLNEFYRNDEK